MFFSDLFNKILLFPSSNDDYEDLYLLGYNAVCSGKSLAPFQRNVSVCLQGHKMSEARSYFEAENTPIFLLSSSGRSLLQLILVP
jgi:hypothetical protein